MRTISPTIIYMLTDEAPALATVAFLPIVRAFTAPVGINVVTSDTGVVAIPVFLNVRYSFGAFEDLFECGESSFQHFVGFRMTQANPDPQRAAVHLLKRARRCDRDPGLCCLRYQGDQSAASWDW